MAKEAGLALLFGGASKAAASKSKSASKPKADDYADDEKASLYEEAFGEAPTPEQLNAFRELVHACMSDDEE